MSEKRERVETEREKQRERDPQTHISIFILQYIYVKYLETIYYTLFRQLNLLAFV